MITFQVFVNFVFLIKYPFTHLHGTNTIKTFSKIYLNIMKYVAENLTWSNDKNQIQMIENNYWSLAGIKE
jgi:hypothetical protein